MKIRFWTSTQYSGFMAGLIRELNAMGLDAQQCYHISERSYRSAQQPIARLCLRLRQYVLYPAQLCGALLTQRIRALSSKSAEAGELVVVSTNTFYAPLLATLLHRKVVHLVYDLFPEALIHSGKWREGSIKVKAIRWITRRTLRRAHCNVFLGQRLKDYVESIHGPVPNSAIIAVGADQSLFPHSPEARNEHLPVSAAPIILYCGNFGNLHDSQTLFDYWRNHAPAGTATSPTACSDHHCRRFSRSNSSASTSSPIASARGSGAPRFTHSRRSATCSAVSAVLGGIAS